VTSNRSATDGTSHMHYRPTLAAEDEVLFALSMMRFLCI